MKDLKILLRIVKSTYNEYSKYIKKQLKITKIKGFSA
jgi:hypothetical protein